MADLRYVFLIGAARSGTKFLRDTLAASTDVAAVPYDINYVWRHGNENCPHDELTPDDISPKTASHIRDSVTRLGTKDSTGSERVILEKTVSNTLRVDTIRHVFPEAEFIYLERDGFDAVESSYRQWTQPTDRAYLAEKLRYFPIREWRYALWFAKNLANRSGAIPIWGPRYKGIQADLANVGTAQTCALQWTRSVESARSQTGPDTVSIRYRDLGKPDVFNALLDELGITDAEVVTNRLVSTFSIVSSWPGAIPTEQRSECERIVESAARSD